MYMLQPDVERDKVVKITTEGNVYNHLYQGESEACLPLLPL